MDIKRSGFIKKVKEELIAAFLIIDMDFINFYLDFKIDQNWEKKIIKLSQPIYINKVLKKYYLSKANTINIFIKKTKTLMPRTNSKVSPSKRETYQGIAGLLMFFIIKTRPDIIFLILVISRFAKNLSRQYNKAVKTIFQFLKGSKNRDITYKEQNKLFFKKYSDSNWANNKESQKLTLGYIFILNGKPVS